METLANKKMDVLVEQFRDLEKFYQEVKLKGESRFSFLYRLLNTTEDNYNPDRLVLLSDKIRKLWTHTKGKDTDYDIINRKLNAIGRILGAKRGTDLSLTQEDLALVSENLTTALLNLQVVDEGASARVLDNKRLNQFLLKTKPELKHETKQVSGYLFFKGDSAAVIVSELKDKGDQMTQFDRNCINATISLNKLGRLDDDTLYLFVDTSVEGSAKVSFKKGCKEEMDLKVGLADSPKITVGEGRLTLASLDVKVSGFILLV